MWRAVRPIPRFVLGDPTFYSRFGFDPDLASGFMCRFSGANLMAPLLAESYLPERVIEYASDFSVIRLMDVRTDL